MKRIILTVLAIVSMSSGALVLAGNTAVFADAKAEVCAGIGAATEGGAGCTGGSAKINQTAKNVVNVLSAIVGMVSVVMLIIGGFKYATSGGDSAKVASAKDTILYAIVGILVVALAQAIVFFVLERVVQ